MGQRDVGDRRRLLESRGAWGLEHWPVSSARAPGASRGRDTGRRSSERKGVEAGWLVRWRRDGTICDHAVGEFCSIGSTKLPVSSHGHPQGGHDKAALKRWAESPPDDPAATGIQHGAQIQPTLSGSQIGNIAPPYRICFEGFGSSCLTLTFLRTALRLSAGIRLK